MVKLCLTFAIILCILSVALVKGFDKEAAWADYKTKTNSCKAEVGAKDVDVEELFGKKPASSMEGKCLRSCVMKKYEVIDNNGKFVKSVALSHAEEHTDGAQDKMKIVREMMDACSGIEVSADHCEAAEQYENCFREQAKVQGIKEDFM